MKLSTKIARIQMKGKIIDEAVEFAKAYHSANSAEVAGIYRKLSDNLETILKIK